MLICDPMVVVKKKGKDGNPRDVHRPYIERLGACSAKAQRRKRCLKTRAIGSRYSCVVAAQMRQSCLCPRPRRSDLCHFIVGYLCRALLAEAQQRGVWMEAPSHVSPGVETATEGPNKARTSLLAVTLGFAYQALEIVPMAPGRVVGGGFHVYRYHISTLV